FVRYWKRLPGFGPRVLGDLRSHSTLRTVRIVSGAASGRTLAIFRRAPASTTSTGDVAHVEDRPLISINRQVLAVAVGDRASGVDKLRSQNAPGCFESLRRLNRDSRREPKGDREVCGVGYAYQGTTGANKALKVRDSAPPQTRSHIVGLIYLSEIGS